MSRDVPFPLPLMTGALADEPAVREIQARLPGPTVDHTHPDGPCRTRRVVGAGFDLRATGPQEIEIFAPLTPFLLVEDSGESSRNPDATFDLGPAKLRWNTHADQTTARPLGALMARMAPFRTFWSEFLTLLHDISDLENLLCELPPYRDTSWLPDPSINPAPGDFTRVIIFSDMILHCPEYPPTFPLHPTNRPHFSPDSAFASEAESHASRRAVLASLLVPESAVATAHARMNTMTGIEARLPMLQALYRHMEEDCAPGLELRLPHPSAIL